MSSKSEITKDRTEALLLCPSLRRITAELEIYEALLRRWQETINLVAAPTLNAVWTRHFADSAQVFETLPDISQWADLGSGAGFPGLVTALLLKPRAGAAVHLIESDQRKAAFLRAVSRETGAPAVVHVGRIEKEIANLPREIGGVSARALAPLPRLVDWSHDLLLKSAVGAFLKGEDWRAELTEAKTMVSFELMAIPSRTNPNARLITVRRRP